MNPWIAKAVVLVSSVMIIVIRAPHGQRARGLNVVKNRKGGLETGLLTFAWFAFLLPLVWMTTPLLAFADYSLRPGPLIAGVLCLALGLWLFHRSHADLGTNWSVTLEVREKHQLVTHGIYRHVRHPMYLSLLVYSLGQALVLPNLLAGPSYGFAMALVFAFRLGPEERMMLEAFGKDYETYQARTRRLVRGVW